MKIKGRKRHILVDTLGLILSSIVLPTNISDRKGAFYLLEGKQLFLPAINDIYADGGYTGNKFVSEIKKRTNWTLRIIKRPQCQGFKLLARRWIVERTFAWLNKSRRLSKDYELSV